MLNHNLHKVNQSYIFVPPTFHAQPVPLSFAPCVIAPNMKSTVRVASHCQSCDITSSGGTLPGPKQRLQQTALFIYKLRLQLCVLRSSGSDWLVSDLLSPPITVQVLPGPCTGGGLGLSRWGVGLGPGGLIVDSWVDLLTEGISVACGSQCQGWSPAADGPVAAECPAHCPAPTPTSSGWRRAPYCDA